MDPNPGTPVSSSSGVPATAATTSIVAATSAAASSSPPPLVSETRMEVIQRTLQLLREEVLVPYYEPVERLRVTNNRAVSLQDLVETFYSASFEKSTSV
ncbi:hypothetical protein DQ04_04141060 [Trypanosoma grayi]|uniref:hypothetical protein n=1 Tax=Trypanosoma grayi TaxID=71804 RepID=UPI0004F438CF|nr:hypothetical protein DQ04_04141060 [Trypanosoma grayi]KEG10129.1 hypothetical protein DQ04_04141060 [Trypanosoma grayi]